MPTRFSEMGSFLSSLAISHTAAAAAAAAASPVRDLVVVPWRIFFSSMEQLGIPAGKKVHRARPAAAVHETRPTG